MTNNFAVLILAAGLGTRMKSRHAKVLHRAGGRTLIELAAWAATQVAPAGRVYIVVGYQADEVRGAVEHLGVRFVHQPEQLGTGHAVLVAREAVQSVAPHLMVFYGDCPLIKPATLAALAEQHVSSGAAATVLTTKLPDPTGYGRIVRDSRGQLEAIVEEKAASAEQKAIAEINSGIYCFKTSLAFDCLAGLRPDNPAKEYYLTDVIAGLRSRGLPVASFPVADYWQVLGINNRVELAEVDAILRNKKAEELMLAGVTIQRPETVTLDLDVSIAPDTVLEPFVQVLGRSTIGSGCLVRSYSVISDSQIAADVTIEPFTVIHKSHVEHGAHIGPYARLRTDNHVGAAARVGNFVELKNTRLGAGSRAMHLAYLGDSTIGSDVNIGAGTITCNYDGISKNPTRIGDGAFVGSNSTLVAPIEIGSGAYLAAGSTLTENVPADSLAIARSRQSIKPGWAAARRKKGA